MTKVLVLGGTGMLGSMIVSKLAQEGDLDITATGRNFTLRERGKERLPSVHWIHFDALTSPISSYDWIINAIGITKPHIDESNHYSVLRAININARFPYHLIPYSAKVIQIATDCVFSGTKGNYVETDSHDATDVYGKSKSLGEVRADNFYNLRCSIIGPEPRLKSKFLIDWLIKQPEGATVQGFSNHLWNGITTLHFAKLCYAIIKNDLAPLSLMHVVPGESVDKWTLLNKLAQAYGRTDITINKKPAEYAVDRTLSTAIPDVNAALWKAAGYKEIPDMDTMLTELADFDYTLQGLDSL